jgi:hypothetical protein
MRQSYIYRRVGVGRLELSLVCDLDPEHEYVLEAARLTAAPLMLFTPLNDCHVRLGKVRNRPLEQLAQEAVLHTQSTTAPPPLESTTSRISSSLLSLPLELHLHILEYTDLITPWKEVTWSRQTRGY